MKFSFRYKKEKDASGYIYRPKIPLLLSNNGKCLEIMGLLDSGSDTLSIPSFIARYLGIKLSPRKQKVQGIGGPVEVRYGLVNVTVRSKMKKHIIRGAKVAVPFNDDDQIDDIIIGRIPFFWHFRITFDENARRVILLKARRH